MAKSSYKEDILNRKGEYINNLQNKIEFKKTRQNRLSKSLEEDRQNRIRLGMNPQSTLQRDDEKEIKKLETGMKRLQSKIKNADKVFEFVAEHEPHTYGMNIENEKIDKIEETVRKDNPKLNDDAVYDIVQNIVWTIDNLKNAVLSYIDYREDISSDTGLSINKIPEHPFKIGIPFLKKSLVYHIKEDAIKKNAKLSNKSAWDVVNEVL
jgi:hypothetical protein